MICPECLADYSKVIEVKRLTNGSIRRRYRCRSCANRWTRYQGDPPGHRGGWPAGKKAKPRLLFTPDEIKLILLSEESSSVLAKKTGRSRWAVNQVRSGRTYKNVHSEIPRRSGLSCRNCDHWSLNGCDLKIPDQPLEGNSFANDCSSYTPKFKP